MIFILFVHVSEWTPLEKQVGSIKELSCLYVVFFLSTHFIMEGLCI